VPLRRLYERILPHHWIGVCHARSGGYSGPDSRAAGRMSKRSRFFLIAAGFACLAILGTLLVLRSSRSEPSHSGITLSQWLLLLDSQTEHKAANEAAAQAIGAMGERSVPELMRVLRKRPDRPVIAAVKNWAIRCHLWRPPALELVELQCRAGRACCILAGRFEVDIRQAIPDLGYHLTNTTYVQEPFAWALVYSGKEGLAVVTNALARAGSPRAREEAARSLWITPKVRTPEIANALVQATHDSDATVRVSAILTLRSFARNGGFEQIVAPAAIRCLQDKDPEVRRWAVELLGSYRSNQKVEDTLRITLADPDPNVQEQARQVLKRKK
jgi:hypothetical protein